jgi:hypothetical protein
MGGVLQTLACASGCRVRFDSAGCRLGPDGLPRPLHFLGCHNSATDHLLLKKKSRGGSRQRQGSLLLRITPAARLRVAPRANAASGERPLAPARPRRRHHAEWACARMMLTCQRLA